MNSITTLPSLSSCHDYREAVIIALKLLSLYFHGHVVTWLRPRRKDLEIHRDGKKLKQRDSFIYLGGALCGDSNSDTP